MDGYFKINRKILSHDLWLLEPFTKGQAWADLIGLASFKKTVIKIKNGAIVNIQRGDCAWSQIKLAERWKWSRGKVKRFLDYLESEKMIQQKNADKLTIIGILNYNFYQNDTTNSTTNSTTNGHIRRMIKNDKNDNTHINDARTTGLEKKECVCVDLTEKEKKILKGYARKSNANNVDAYIYSLVKNGSYKEIIENANDKEKVRELPPKIEIVEEAPEVTEQAFLKFQEKLKEIKRSKINEKGNSMAETFKAAKG